MKRGFILLVCGLIFSFGASNAWSGTNWEVVARINSDINQEIYYRPDYSGDVWSLSGRYGDCEDYALRKIDRLASVGIKAMIGVFFLASGQFHAVAIVDGFVLDNRTDQIVTAPKFLWVGELRGREVWMIQAVGKNVVPQVVRMVQ